MNNPSFLRHWIEVLLMFVWFTSAVFLGTLALILTDNYPLWLCMMAGTSAIGLFTSFVAFISR